MADATIVLNVVPSVEACRDRVWVLALQAVDAGSCSTTRLTLWELPRSTWTHCGNVPFALSQYVFWLPSVTLADA